MKVQVNRNRASSDRLEKLMIGVQCTYGYAVEGDIAEFGTAMGLSATLLANAIRMSDGLYTQQVQCELGRPKNLHLFDSFQGFPDVSQVAIDQDAIHVRSQVWPTGRHCSLSPEQLFEECVKILPAERIRIYEGWYADTVGTIPDDTRFAMLHLDCDLYSSTMDVLRPLLQRGMLSEGAYLLFDDWDCNCASPKFGQRRAWKECVKEFDIDFSDHGEYGLGSHKFIVHEYRQ